MNISPNRTYFFNFTKKGDKYVSYRCIASDESRAWELFEEFTPEVKSCFEIKKGNLAISTVLGQYLCEEFGSR